jgi:hypothetical protein
MKEEFYKDFPKDEPKESVPKTFITPPPKSNITDDFKTGTKMINHARKLSDEGKKSFAAKYGIPYKDVSEICGNARWKFYNS